MRTVHRLGLLGVIGLAVCVCWSAGPLVAQPGSDPLIPPGISSTAQYAVPPAKVSEPQTVEELINALATVKAKQDDLAKQEQTLKAALKKKLQEQRDKLKKLGIPSGEEAPTPVTSY
jgi:hypothetical protein